MKKPRRRLVILLLILLATGAFAYYKFTSRPPAPSGGLSVTGGSEMSVRIETPLFRQWDPRWGNDKLGSTSASLRNYGCTVSATAMALTSQGIKIEPGELNSQLTANNGFTDSGLLIWKGIETVTNEEFGIALNNALSHQLIDQQLKKGNPLIAKVFYNEEIWHWVLITGKEGSQYLMHDPLSVAGKHQSMKDYRSGIFGIRYLKKL